MRIYIFPWNICCWLLIGIGQTKKTTGPVHYVNSYALWKPTKRSLILTQFLAPFFWPHKIFGSPWNQEDLSRTVRDPTSQFNNMLSTFFNPMQSWVCYMAMHADTGIPSKNLYRLCMIAEPGLDMPKNPCQSYPKVLVLGPCAKSCQNKFLDNKYRQLFCAYLYSKYILKKDFIHSISLELVFNMISLCF